MGFLDPRWLLFPSFGPAFRTWTRATSSSGMSRSKSPIEQSNFSSRFDAEMKKLSMPSSTVTLEWRCDVMCVTSSLSSKDPVSPPAGGGLPWNRRGLGVFLIRSETNYLINVKTNFFQWSKVTNKVGIQIPELFSIRYCDNDLSYCHDPIIGPELTLLLPTLFGKSVNISWLFQSQV